ncbi:class I SAM-dependent methyltransferase [Auraticoccus monumenti]|uniref:Methyltransferase small domain-containing protein n=1 Tax=Auraticoccus monumenti TaxID=675864 RepID=A0A1G6XD98_9ACTN|nr:methyltransferase [Auraticoccus monumenti]SDD76214.1 Methyltransferase small domain-containing protein [Auraticoccus monumenti]
MSHYFTTPEGPEQRRPLQVTLWGHELGLQTAGGVFSANSLDLATQVLLRSHRPAPTSRRLLDLGCGWGPIALALALELPDAVVDAVDVNERAVALTRDNARAAGVGGRVRALLPDAVGRKVRYDEIWSNPPIRVGKEALHELLLTWLPRLADDGVARLVVGRHLGADTLQRWLVEQGHPCQRTASAKGFRVLEVRPRV